MQFVPMRVAACGLVLLATTMPASAGWGRIDGFGASATTVSAGSEVQFWVGYSVAADASQQWGGSNLVEPPPQEGTQYWDLNWYYTSSETITAVSVSAGGQAFTDFLSPAPGGSHSGGWSFSLSFDTPGSYQLEASGQWESWLESYSSSESAYRNCWYNDPDAQDQLVCDWWTYQYYDYADSYSGGGALEALSLTITVTAVPEPATLALWCAGLATLATRRRR